MKPIFDKIILKFIKKFRDMSISEVTEEVNSLEQSIFSQADTLELLKQAIGFTCDKLDESG